MTFIREYGGVATTHPVIPVPAGNKGHNYCLNVNNRGESLSTSSCALSSTSQNRLHFPDRIFVPAEQVIAEGVPKYGEIGQFWANIAATLSQDACFQVYDGMKPDN